MCHVYGHHVPTSADLEVLGVQDRGPGMGQGRGSRRRAIPAGVPAGWCGAFRAQAARAQDRGSVEPPQDPALHPFSSNVVDAQHKLYITGSTATCLVQRHCLCSHHSTYFWNVLVTATETPPPLAVSTPHHTLLSGKPLIYLLSFWVICVNGIIKHEAFMSGFFHSA